MKITITRGLPEDRWEEYKNIRIAALKDVPQAFLGEVEWSEDQEKDFWIERSKNVVFAEVGGKVVGTTGFYREEKKKQQHIMNVVGVFVLSEYRGHKIGKQLMEKVLEIIKKNPEITIINLGVIETQETAKKMYESFGFVTVGKLKKAVKVGVTYYDEYLMQIDLEE